MKSAKKNYIYNLMYQILILILPLITAPYISRVIGADGTGIYSYTYSIANYFVIFAMLGLENHGNRTIARVRENRQQVSKEFYSIRAIQIITNIVILITYSIYALTFSSAELRTYAIAQILFVLSAVFNINWFFAGLEEFKLTVIRNAIIKIISVIAIFTLVKDKDDLLIYVIILAGSMLISQLSLWPFVKKYVNKTKVKWEDIKKHIKPTLILFIPVIAVSLYKIMDKIMLGNLTEMKEVGYYENGEKIINIPMTIITSSSTVMLPRMSNLASKGETEKSMEYIDKSIQFVTFLAIPMALGLMIVGPTFAPIYFGSEFIKTGNIISLLAITMIFLAWNEVIRRQYLIPNKRDKEYIIAVFSGAIINFILNLILIPQYKSIGATIATVFAEFCVVAYQIYSVRKILPIKEYFLKCKRFIFSGIIMGANIIVCGIFIKKDIIKVIIQIMLGIVIYSGLNYTYLKNNIKQLFIKNRQ